MSGNSSGKRWFGRIVIAMLAVVVSAGLVIWMTNAYKDKVDPGRSTLPQPRLASDLKTVAIQWINTPLIAEAVGTVRAKHKTEIASKLLARVERVMVRAGDTVKEGQLLVELDTREWQARKSAAVAALEAARADLELRKQEFDRMSHLLARKSTSQQDFDVSASRRDAAIAKVKQAKQEILVVESSLVCTKISAPVSGKIIERLVEAGDMATPGKTLLTMYDPTNLRLESIVREALVPYINLGQDLTVVVESIGLRGTGVVEEIVPQASAATRAFIVKVAMPHVSGLYPGMFGRLKIPHGVQRRLLIPKSAVLRVGQVELVEIAGPDNTLVRRQIKTGEYIGENVEVLSGLDPPVTGQKPQLVVIH